MIETSEKNEDESLRGVGKRELAPEHGSLSDLYSSYADLGIVDVVSLYPPEVLANACKEDGRYYLHGEAMAQLILPVLREKISEVDITKSLMIDLQGVTLSSDFILPVLQSFFFPKAYDYHGTDRFVREKRVFFANPDTTTLLGMAPYLELAHAHCLVVPDTGVFPWELYYVGHIDERLEIILRKIYEEGPKTAVELASELQPGVKEKDQAVTSRKFTPEVGDLYKFGLLVRQKIPSEGRGQNPYQYTYYHPFWYVIPSWTRPPVEFFRAPRPARGRTKNTRYTSPEDPEPEPLVDPSLQASRVMRAIAEIGGLRHLLTRETTGLARQLAAWLWIAWGEVLEYVSDKWILEFHDQLVLILNHNSDEISQLERGRLLYSLGLLTPAGNADLARGYFEQSRDVGKAIGDTVLISRSLLGLGRLCFESSDYKHAQKFYDESLRLGKEISDEREISKALGNLGILEATSGSSEISNDYLIQSLTQARRGGDKLQEAKVLTALGTVAANRSEKEKAGKYYEDAQRICHEFGFKRQEGVLLVDLGTLAWSRNDHRLNIELARKAAAIYEDIDAPLFRAAALINLGASETVVGDYAQAHKDLKESVRISQGTDTRSIVFAVEELARLCTHLEFPDEAVRIYGAAAKQREIIPIPVTKEEEPSYRGILMTMRDDIGKERYDLNWNTGERMDWGKAIDFAIAFTATILEMKSTQGHEMTLPQEDERSHV